MAEVKEEREEFDYNTSLFELDKHDGLPASTKIDRRTLKCPIQRAPLKFKLKLIKEVQARPILWDKNSRFKNKTLIGYVWHKVAQNLKVPDDYCKRHWKTLVKSYKIYLNGGKEMPEELMAAMQFMKTQITFYKTRIQNFEYSRGDEIRDSTQPDKQINSPIEIVDLVYSDEEEKVVDDRQKVIKEKKSSPPKKNIDEIIMCNSLMNHILNDSLRSNTVSYFKDKLVEFVLEIKPHLSEEIIEHVLANPQQNYMENIEDNCWEKFGIPKDIGYAISGYVVTRHMKKCGTPTKSLRNRFQFQD